MTNAEARDIARRLNSEAVRTDGAHGISHVLVVDGVGYFPPRRRYYTGHWRNPRSGKTYHLPRVSASDVPRLVAGKASACTCSDCRMLTPDPRERAS